jgi:formylglycine-generating enzyme required for sulfatase activity
LIYALKQGSIKNSDCWLYETIKPGRDPIESLALAFSRVKSPELANYFRQHIDESNILHECAESALSHRKNQRLVLFIDQFEEAFTQVSKDKAETFINILTNAATTENGRVIILFSMRSDFVSNCATYPQLNDLLNQQFIQIGAMQPDELVSAIAQPALRVGLRIDPDLIAQIINDMQSEPGALPLMQFALKDLFDSQEAQSGVIVLTLNDYLQRGGIHKALERHADASFAKLDKNEQELARSIFSGLIEIGRGTQDTRRTALFDELVPANAKTEEVKAVVQRLADARLITTYEQAGRDTVTLAHEKLIDAWPWLRKLVHENREAIALQNRIAEDSGEWEAHERDASYLYTGARLANVHEQFTARKIMLSGLAKPFVEAGFELEGTQRQREEARRQKELEDARRLTETTAAHLRAEQRGRRRLQMLVGVLAALIVGMFAVLIRPYILRAMAQGEMAKIAAGRVIIGTNDVEASEEEMPQWTIDLAGFEIDRYEVSNYQYSLCVSAGRCQEPNDPTRYRDSQYADYPVAGVTAFQADAYCRWLDKRLPTELEWERAARGPNGRLWPWGDADPSPETANLAYNDNAGGVLLPAKSLHVGTTPAPENVYNLVGNVWEWTSSYMQAYTNYDPALYWDSRDGPPIYGLVQRGGSWDDNTLTRVTRRDSINANDAIRQVGIRCAKSQ